jgi:hypothetical protein
MHELQMITLEQPSPANKKLEILIEKIYLHHFSYEITFTVMTNKIVLRNTLIKNEILFRILINYMFLLHPHQ